MDYLFQLPINYIRLKYGLAYIPQGTKSKMDLPDLVNDESHIISVK